MEINASETREQTTPLGKSAVLRWLDGRIQHAKVPEFLSISVEEWRTRRGAILGRCLVVFGGAELAVRSDAAVEDGWLASHAGAFRTLLDVDPSGLAQALDEVAASMPGHPRDGILVQRMVPTPQLVGVASTHRIGDGAPWYCIEWSEHGAASVTGGRATGRQICVARDAPADLPVLASGSPVALVMALLREVEAAVGSFPLEIEFALGTEADGNAWIPYLLQMRPLAAAGQWTPAEGRPGRGRLPPLEFLLAPDRVPDVVGGRTVLSLMADWNPAELIGAHPRPLARSLFEHLIADGIWWEARTRLGYAPMPSPGVALLRTLRGRPFVDARRSANSLLPTGLPKDLRGRVVDRWMAQLAENPALHDKVEFRIFRTVQDFTIHPQGDSMPLSADEHVQWDAALQALTRRLMGAGSASPLADWCAIVAELERDDLHGWSAASLLRRCRAGTLAFAAIARLAFVGESQLRSAVQRGALSPERALALRAAARSHPIPHASNGQTVLNYLRPGTFDITRPVWSGDPEVLAARHDFQLDGCEALALDHLLQEAELPLPARQWVAFVQQAASAREWSKQVFSRHLSTALEDIALQAEAVGLEREHASWLTLQQWLQGLQADPATRAADWLRCAEQARRIHLQESRLVTGPVLRGPEDRDVADSLGALPNFIGENPVHGPLRPLDDPEPCETTELQGSIVLISKADPGFDWLFGQGIAGLVTEWGGANSHMAIRCAEFGLPAAMGCGASVYTKARKARVATIDPGAQSLWFA